MRALKRSLLVLALAIFGCCQQAADSTVTIIKGNGEELQVRVEIADTPALRSRGLMFRESLQEGTGMLFVFPAETQGGFWMKNTPISLDILFIRQEEIVSVIESAVPYDETSLVPDSPYTSALEVPGGYASRHDVRVGDTAVWDRGSGD